MDALEWELLRDLVEEEGGPFLISGNEIFIGREHWTQAVEWFRRHSAEVLGFDGFDFDGFDEEGRYLRVRLDYIADFQGITGVDALAETALRVLRDWEATADRPQFVSFVARRVGDNTHSPS